MASNLIELWADVATAEGKEASLVILGEKGKAQLQRDRRDKILSTVTELGKQKMTFAQVRRRQAAASA